MRWIKIAQLFEGRRTDVQCRERFMNILNPAINAADEDHLNSRVVQLYEHHGDKWAAIAKEVSSLYEDQVQD